MLLEKRSSREFMTAKSDSTLTQSKTPSRTFQILFYAVRPGFVRSQKLTWWHAANLIIQVMFNVLVLRTMGSRALIYFIMSSFFSGSLHPLAGHFIAEHYVWDGIEQETYSYYGPLNILAYNVSPPAPVTTQALIASTFIGWISQ